MLTVSPFPAPRQHALEQAALTAVGGQRLGSAAAVCMVYGALFSAPLVWLGAALWAHAAGIGWLAVCLAVQAVLAAAASLGFVLRGRRPAGPPAPLHFTACGDPSPAS